MNKPENRPFVLVDGSSYLYRAFHAMPSLTNSKGEPTGAVYGVINMLHRLLKDYQPEQIAVVFDAKGKTFRDELYPEYKAHRPPMPQALQQQIEPIHAIIRAMGLPLLIIDGVEADDVIGTLARQAGEQGRETVISTGDKDLAQLVNEHVTLINTMNGSVLNPQTVREKFGVPPGRIVDYLALIGDSVDNIPGVPKVGPKTAAKWLHAYGSLDGVIAHAGEIKGKVGENLRASLEQLPLSRQLVTIKQDVALPVTPRQLTRQPPDVAKLRQLYQQLEFKSWLEQLLKETENSADNGKGDDPDYRIITTREAFEQWYRRLAGAELFAFDTETTSLNYMQAEIVGLSFAIQPTEAAYIPLAHDYDGAPPQLPREEILERLRPLLEDPDRAKLGQHLKYDMNVLANHGISLRGVRYDTMLESYVLDSTATRHDLDSLALKYLGRTTIHYEDVAGKGAKQLSFNQVPLEQAGPYAAEDAEITLSLHRVLWPRLSERPTLRRLFEEVEMPLVPVLSVIERNGVLVDRELLRQQSRELAAKITAIEQEAHQMAGETFNLGSPKQIQNILYNKLELPVKAKTPKGQPSTAESVLQELALEYPLPRLILEYRGMSKLKSTYTDKLPQLIDPHTGRIHTSYHQAVTATGRLSSSDPNLQNIPVRTPEGRRIRQAFIAAEGNCIVSADYSQIELRIMAHLSNDPRLLEAFAAGEDIHRATAAEIFGVALEQVTVEQRRSAKAINFGLIYGMSAFGLARQLGIERNAAQTYVDRYFERYPGVKRFMDRTREQARQQGYVETVFGRRLYLPEINAANTQRRQYAERTAINAPMQGSAADIIKRAMIDVHRWLERSGLAARMIMQVHDELVFEVHQQDAETLCQQLRQRMAAAADLNVPLTVDVGVGKNWDQAH